MRNTRLTIFPVVSNCKIQYSLITAHISTRLIFVQRTAVFAEVTQGRHCQWLVVLSAKESEKHLFYLIVHFVVANVTLNG